MSKTEIVTFRLSPEEYDLLKTKTQNTELSQSDYIRKCLENKPVVKVYQPRELLRQISRIGNNINQIARVANSSGIINDGNLWKVNQDVKELQRTMHEFISEADVLCP